MAATQRTNPASVSPKVKASAWTGLALTLLGALLTGITPEMLDFLGDWKGTVFGVVTAASMVYAAWRKSDPARWDLTLNHPEAEAPAVWTPEPVVIPDPDPVASEVGIVYPEEDDAPGKHEATPAG